MSRVLIQQIEVTHKEDCQVGDGFQFKIRFECHENLAEDLDWKVIYVGSSLCNTMDQELDELSTGPITPGTHEFVLDVPGPEPTRIPSSEIVGVTVVLITCSYLDQEFVRVGYYINNEYKTLEMRENPPAVPIISELRRVICDSPRVTRIAINWNENKMIVPTAEEEAQATEEDEMGFGDLLCDVVADNKSPTNMFAPSTQGSSQSEEMALD